MSIRHEVDGLWVKAGALWLPAYGIDGTPTMGQIPRWDGSKLVFDDETVSSGGATVLYDSGYLVSAANSIDTGAAGIAGGYDILEMLFIGRTDTTNANINITLNNDTGTHYHRQFIRGVNTTASANTGVGEAAWFVAAASTTQAANNPAIITITIPFYTGTTFYKIAACMAGNADTAGATNRRAEMQAMTWASAAAITRAAFAANAGVNLIAGSRLIIKGR